ncbi:MAG: ABC transporter ATP-binding protein [Propionibacteriaceae bacterium]|jgi:peptide/nickel transport system ATP-binding protein|nr:ABC transporter ATP-binding protein [Propionibacteriaceae bacterium]
MTALVVIENLRVQYSATSGEASAPAVRGADLVVHGEETLAIVGESGSGKTTIANAVMGLLPGGASVTGAIHFGHQDLAALSPRAWRHVRGAQIGYIPQDPMTSLNEVWSIGRHFRQTIAAHRLADGVTGGWRALSKERLLEVGLVDTDRILKQFPHQLSGGMRQRVLIALAVLARPKLIVADEPTSALDVVVQKQVLDLLERLTKRLGASLILITHDLGLVADRSDRVVVMHDGDIVESGPTDEVVSYAGHSYTKRLLQAVPKLSAAQCRPVADLEPETVLTVEGLVKDFRLRHAAKAQRHLRAVDGVDLIIHRGECLALVGESGSGKSTVAKLILGLERPTAGTVRLGSGEPVQPSRPSRSGRAAKARCRNLQVVFQDPYASLDPQFTVVRTLAEPLLIHGQGASDERRTRLAELLDLVGLPEEIAGRYPSELSGGQRQRVAIARALALAPEVLICDEAVSALDVLVQAQILDTLSELRRRLGLSMLFITHDLAVVAEIADTVAVINQGRIVETGPVPTVFAHPTDPHTKELLSAVPGQALFHTQATL